ncbi:MAG: hypothetical protein QOD84_1046 [Acidobacteriaceae bacterium]|jgi:heme-degrading monooxygenase HmoA|nr:hypothetical protein [Acidobacteriaceae bacterium]
MYARNVAMHLKPNTMTIFQRTFDNSVLPILRKQAGFQDEIIFASDLGGTEVTAISLWDTKAHAEAYNSTGYLEVLKSLNSVLDGIPKLRSSDVLSSTLRQAAHA